MGDEDDSTRPPERISNKPEPPYQALLPEFDKMSRSSFEKGTVSRRRINRALLLLALIPLAVLAAVFLPQLSTTVEFRADATGEIWATFSSCA